MLRVTTVSDFETRNSVVMLVLVLRRFGFFSDSSSFVWLFFPITVYLWAEVLDADVYAAFKETGNVFDPEMAERVRKYVYSSGNTEAPDELFRKFRGRDPDIQFMLEKKSLVAAS